MTDDPPAGDAGPATYAAAGVDVAAGERAVSLMRKAVAGAGRPEVLGGLGGFAGLFRADFSGYRRPVLATSTDGVGTKVLVAQRLDRHDTVGIDLVGMVADDLVVCGAEPLFMTDYIACGKLDPDRVTAIVAGVAEGCRRAGCALVGGETAEHPGVMGPDEYDLAGAGTGVVDEYDLLGPHRVREGDAVLAMASSGLHANGFSLVRHVFSTQAGWALDRWVAELGRTLGEELLEPTCIYARDCLALAGAVDLHALAHVTGGGPAANLARVLPDDVDAVVDRATWSPQAVFGLVADVGRVQRDEMERTFNMGVGMFAVVAREATADAVRLLGERGLDAWVAGDVRSGDGSVRLVGEHRR